MKNEIFKTEDLNKIHADVPVLFLTSNRGRTFRLFDNPHHHKVGVEFCFFSFSVFFFFSYLQPLVTNP